MALETQTEAAAAAGVAGSTASAPPSDPRYFAKHHTGEPYHDVLARLHRVLAPRTYLEIGILRGDTLKLASAPAIAIDPRPRLPKGFRSRHCNVTIYRQTSDAFFEEHDPSALLGAPLDFAFLDGLHTAEQLLRDFINTERFASPDGVIVLHDCLPSDLGQARAAPADPADHTRNRGCWAGDVWRLVPMLRKYRPDLVLNAFDAPPTGLMVVTGLDPANRRLADNEASILAQMKTLDLEAIGVSAFMAAQKVRPTTALRTREDLKRPSLLSRVLSGGGGRWFGR